MKDLQPNIQKSANILSFCTFWWMGSFFAKGAKKTLKEEDMFELLKDDTSVELCQKLERNWKKELKKKNHGGIPSLGRAFAKTYAFRFLQIGIYTAIDETLQLANPVLVAKLVRYFEHPDVTPVWHAYLYAGIISINSFIIAVFHHLYFYYVQRLGWHMRAAACALMYKKTLRLSVKSLGQTTTGQIVNLGATDVMRFDVLPMFLNYLWIGPVQSAVVAFLIWDDVGPAVLAGMAVLFLLMIIQGAIGRPFGTLRMKTAVITDERIRTMNEVITGMRIIKMYTWEKPFAKLVETLRKSELNKIMRTYMLRAFNLSMCFCSPKIITCATFLVFVSIGGELTASKVFKVIGTYNVIRVSMGLCFPLAIEKLAESAISTSRIEKFLLLDEIESIQSLSETKSSKDCFVEMKNYSGKWHSNDEETDSKSSLTLRDINVRVESGQLLAVIGPVGAGKSSFLNAILGELPKTSGSLTVDGKVTFANQVPWVFAGTVQENILFGEEYDGDWYDRVVKACALERDLKLLPNGDQTMVGERGVTLSGGQKARVNLARATYRKGSGVCLLDDPLSAVDAAVGNHIFQHCISGLMKDKVRILVTHQLQLLQDADQIIILKEGTVAGHGTYDELQADGTDFAALLQEREKEEEKEKLSSQFSDTEDELSALIKPKLTASTMSLNSVASQNGYIPQETPEEMTAQGSVGHGVYVEYFRCGAGVFFYIVFLIIALVAHVAFIFCDWWIAVWATEYERYSRSALNSTSSGNVTTIFSSNETSPFSGVTYMPVTSHETTSPWEPEFSANYYMIGYGLITLGMFIAFLIHAIMHFYFCLSSGSEMHNKMVSSILRVPIRFFDTNPSGRILNRFSKDIGQIDDLLPLTFFDFLYTSGFILSVLILAISVNYLVVIIVLPLIVFFFWLRQYYLKTLRDVKRLEGSTRSPVFSFLSSTLQGLLTVRAFGVAKEFEKKFHDKQDLHSCAWYLFLAGGRWLGVHLDLLCAAFVTAVAFLSIATVSLIHVEPGQVGLTLTYSIMLLRMFQWGVRQSTEVENLMTSVERVQQYYSVPPEGPEEVPEKQPPSDWPRHGVLTFENVSFSHYDGGPNVLKRIRINVKAQEKVGIVGRTGAGKSSLISALFRLSELTGGEILIDGIPISPLGLNDLRSSLSIIPQDPILFTGTMRRNLDPFGQFSDEDLWYSLEQVQLKEVVESLPSKLNTELAESGSNFSVGQRQLVCLARAVLRKNKILVIDEATANVDIRTDRLIQLTIREKFKHCTVLTIAHRINTIVDSDRVLVLDDGQVQEFDEPHLLLLNPDSVFSKMIESTSNTEADALKRHAEEAYKARNETDLGAKVDDKDRSYLARFLPTVGTYDELQLETGL